MSQIDENQIHERLKRLSQVEPTKEASDRAMQKVRDALITNEGGRVGLAPPSLMSRLTRLAAAAVLMIGAGFVGGRLSAPEPLDVQQLQAALESSLKTSLEPVIRQAMLAEVENRWQSAFAAGRAQIKDELARQARYDMTQLASQTLTAAGTQTDQRLKELIQLIEAARIQDRRRIEEALEHIERQFGSGLVTLATQTNELKRLE